MVTTACGSRRTAEELRAALTYEEVPGSGSVTSEADDGPAQVAGPTEAPTATAPSEVAGQPQAQPTNPAAQPGPSTPGGGAQAGPAPKQPVEANKDPLVIGSVGPLSGLAGSTLATGVDGLRVWVRWINDRGGLNGHPVELIAVDDQADPSRHRQLVQELVDDRGVVAFVQNGLALSGQSAISFHQERQIPVIGSEGGSQYMYENSMYFPQMSTGDHLVLMQIGSTATYAHSVGITKYGTIVCQEAQVCRDSARLSQEYADDFGLELVYNAQASLAKPDFTADCINARDAGVEILGVGMDANSLSRLAKACDQQEFWPVYAAAASIANAQHEDDPNIKRLISGSPVAAFPLVSIPAVAEMRDAFATYAPDVQVFAGHMTGWVSGKLLEEAARNIEAPTTAEILEGLWSIKDNDLGGLTHPLTFTEGGTAEPATCWWPIIIEKGTYESPFGEAARCRELL